MNGQIVKFRSEAFGTMGGVACSTRLHYISWQSLSSIWRISLSAGGGVLRRRSSTSLLSSDGEATWSIHWETYRYGFLQGANRRWRRYLLPQSLLARVVRRRICERMTPPRRICVALEPSDEATASSELMVVENLTPSPVVERVVDRRTGDPWPEISVALAKELQINGAGSMPWPDDGNASDWPSEEGIRAKVRVDGRTSFFPGAYAAVSAHGGMGSADQEDEAEDTPVLGGR